MFVKHNLMTVDLSVFNIIQSDIMLDVFNFSFMFRYI